MTPPTVLTAILPDYISYDSNFYYEYSTDVVESFSGAEQRIARWTDYRLVGDLYSPNITEAYLNDIIELFVNCRGRAYGFLMKFWQDYAVTAGPLGTGDGIEDDFQLIRRYTSGSYSVDREIYFPKSGTVHIFFDAVEQMGGWTVSTTTGVVHFAAPPGAGVVITATFEFYFPMRFDTDKLAIKWETYDVGKATLPVIEVR